MSLAHYPPPMKTIHCKRCREPFQPKSPNGRYCPRCQRPAQLERSVEYHRAKSAKRKLNATPAPDKHIHRSDLMQAIDKALNEAGEAAVAWMSDSIPKYTTIQEFWADAELKLEKLKAAVAEVNRLRAELEAL